MTQRYEELIDVLEKEFSLCTRLVELLQQEKEIITSLDPEALERQLRDKEAITAGIRMCDEARERMLRELGFSGKTLYEVSKAADTKYGERLSDIASKFSSIIHSITELNRFNSLLIEKSLFYVKTSYNFLNTFDISARQKVSMEA